MTAVRPPEGHVLHVASDPEATFHAAALWIAWELEGMQRRPRIALAGGSTPAGLYRVLAEGPREGPVNWSRVAFTFGDERMVPPDHAESNYAMARQTLFEPAGVRADQVLRIRGEAGAERAAELAQLALSIQAQRMPLFDLVLLGLGEDGHVASLFPAPSWPDFGSRWAAATRHPNGDARVSLTPQALRSTGVTVFLVTGAAKAEAVGRSLRAEPVTDAVPARRVVAPGGWAHWFLDRAAADGLPGEWFVE